MKYCVSYFCRVSCEFGAAIMCLEFGIKDRIMKLFHVIYFIVNTFCTNTLLNYIYMFEEIQYFVM